MTPAEAIADLRVLNGILRTGSFAVPLKECREIVRGDVRKNFESESAPDGAAWPKRKPNPHDDGHPLLDDTGFLKAAALGVGPGGFDDVNNRRLDIGIDKSVDLGGIIAADVHDLGLENMPERHFFAATEEGLDRCGEVIGDYGLEKLLAGGEG